ncbi:hypothetical protein ACRS5S_31690 [Nocardia asiatica]|uniref:hypothetical protein n=1 Tax=Nocardia asiatica TaxID=209252 RepID=UPI003EE14C26
MPLTLLGWPARHGYEGRTRRRAGRVAERTGRFSRAPGSTGQGTARWILLFATGHIKSTLLTVTGISHVIERGVIPLRVAVAADVGAS